MVHALKHRLFESILLPPTYRRDLVEMSSTGRVQRSTSVAREGYQRQRSFQKSHFRLPYSHLSNRKKIFARKLLPQLPGRSPFALESWQVDHPQRMWNHLALESS
jgi:hypothetical protein